MGDTAATAPVGATESEKPVTHAVVPAAPKEAAAKLHSTVMTGPDVLAEEQKTGKKLCPFTEATAESKPIPPTPLMAGQQEKYDSLLAFVQGISTLPVSAEKNAESRPFDDDEKMWLTRECLLRYLRACKWNLAEAKKRLEATLIWRRGYGVLTHTAEYISPENETGKQYILGFDNSGRPCLYLNPGKQNTETSPKQVQHLVFMLERVVDLMGPGQETLALLVDFSASTKRSNPSITQSRQVLDILQSHYPERLGRSLVINLPWFVWGFFKLLNPFIDPQTREKLKFNEDLREHIPPSQLDKRFGGDCDFEYNHAFYWPELNRMAVERRALRTARWRELGSQIGTSEVDIKDESPLSPRESAPEVTTAVEKLEAN